MASCGGLVTARRLLEMDLTNEFEIAGLPALEMEPNAALPKLPLDRSTEGVRDIERLRAEFEVDALRETKRLSDHQIRILKAWPRTGLRELAPMTNCGAAVKPRC